MKILFLWVSTNFMRKENQCNKAITSSKSRSIANVIHTQTDLYISYLNNNYLWIGLLTVDNNTANSITNTTLFESPEIEFLVLLGSVKEREIFKPMYKRWVVLDTTRTCNIYSHRDTLIKSDVSIYWRDVFTIN